MSFTVKVAWPLVLVVPLSVVIVELPLPGVSVTVFPLTGWLKGSNRVTVMVEMVDPSATTEVGLALTVDAVALTAPTVKFTVAV